MKKMKLPLAFVLFILFLLIVFFSGAVMGSTLPNAETYRLTVVGICIIILAIAFGWWGKKSE